MTRLLRGRIALLAVLPLALSGCGGIATSPFFPVTTPSYFGAGTNSSFRPLTASEEFSAYSITGGGENSAPPSPALLQSVETATTRITIRPTRFFDVFQVRVQVAGAPDGVTLDRAFNVDSNTSVLRAWPETDVRLTAFPNRFSASIPSVLVHYHFTGTRTPQMRYQTFGYWLNRPTPSRSDAGVFSFGMVTNPIAIPSSGTATYNGSLLGAAGLSVNTASPSSSTLNARVAATVNFANQSMVLSTTNSRLFVESSQTWVPDSRFDVTGTLGWTPGTNGFSGSVSNATLTSGVAAGRFFGPDAQEMGGVMNAVSADGNTAMTGAFGAVRGAITP